MKEQTNENGEQKALQHLYCDLFYHLYKSMDMKKRYYFFNLEIALRKKDDLNIYAYENISHIPTKKLIEIFNINLKKDPYLVEGYFLTKTNYNKHKKYIKENIGSLNLDIFEYCLRQYITEDIQEIRKLYKEDLME